MARGPAGATTRFEEELSSNPPDGSRLPRVRDDIIEAATRVFSQRGYDAASMTEIADAVGIRKPSLYHHVRAKEDLLFAIHERMIDELIAETRDVIEHKDSPAERLRLVLHVAMSFVARHQDGVTVFLQERRAFGGERWSELVAKRDAYEHIVTGIIQDGIDSAGFIDLPAEISARAVLAMANWGYTWYDSRGPMSPDEIADVFATVALRGLLTR
jgi:TetR/AcrR family transcriptional regulator, cholesterol catabolism regulator